MDVINYKMSLPETCQCGGLKILLKCKCDQCATGYAMDPDYQMVHYCYSCKPDSFIEFKKGFYCELFNRCRYIHDRTKELRTVCDLCNELLWDTDEACEYIRDGEFPKNPNIIGIRYVHNVKTREDLNLCILCCVIHGGTALDKKYYTIDFNANKNICLADTERKCKNFELGISQLEKEIEEKQATNDLLKKAIIEERTKNELLLKQLAMLKLVNLTDNKHLNLTELEIIRLEKEITEKHAENELLRKKLAMLKLESQTDPKKIDDFVFNTRLKELDLTGIERIDNPEFNTAYYKRVTTKE